MCDSPNGPVDNSVDNLSGRRAYALRPMVA